MDIKYTPLRILDFGGQVMLRVDGEYQDRVYAAWVRLEPLVFEAHKDTPGFLKWEEENLRETVRIRFEEEHA